MHAQERSRPLCKLNSVAKGHRRYLLLNQLRESDHLEHSMSYGVPYSLNLSN
jgi:hypothetical protein